MTIRSLLILLLLIVVSACGSLDPPPPTRVPSATPTRISTPLPYVPTALPMGMSADNPLQLLIVPSDYNAARQNVNDVESLINDATDAVVEVAVTREISDALNSLCDTADGLTAIWVDGMSAAIAMQANCGVPALSLVHSDGTTGMASTLFITDDLEVEGSDYQAIADGTFCRISIDDTHSWVVPTMMLMAERIDMADLTSVEEYNSYSTLLTNVGRGRCTAAAVPANVYEDSNTSQVRSIATSAEIPYGVLLFPFGTPLTAIDEISAALIAEAGSNSDPEATPEVDAESTADETLLTAFFGSGALVAVDDNDFRELQTFLRDTRLDFSQLGQ